MKILVACEESQAVTLAFREKGHEAYSCDIQDCSGGYPEWHIKEDVSKVLNQGWDMLIAFPPCTYLSNAGARWLYPNGQLNQNRYHKGLKAKKFFMSLLKANIKHICIENPLPSKAYNLPEPNQIIQPYYFGHAYSKKTFLWLKNLPPLKKTKVMSSHTPYVKSSKHRGAYQPPVYLAKEWSKTFKGVAEAMADQWSKPVYQQQLKLF